MPQITYYFSTISPFTYIAGQRLEEIAKHHDATINYKPLDIMALFSRTGGTPPAQRHESRVEYRLQEIARQARKAGLPIDVRPPFHPTNAAPSSYAFIAAGNTGAGDLGALAHGFTRAVWAEGRDIAQDDVIRDVLSGCGFDPGLADSGLLVGAETYARNLEDAVEAGVFGTPFYITDSGQRFWGQDRLADLDAHLSGAL